VRIEWFTNSGTGFSPQVGDGPMALVGDVVPVEVRLPLGLGEAAGETLRVIGTDWRVCPSCRGRRVVCHRLERGYCVAVCMPLPGCGFVWCRERE
jgi:hypothetical protein